MMKKRLLPLAAAALLLASCQDAPPTTQVPLLGFDQYKPILINAAKIDIVDRYSVPAATGNLQHVELMFKQPPEQAVQLLLKHQLVAGGPSRTLKVYIDDASVTGEKLETTQGLAGMFDNEPAERYHGTIALHFEMVNNDAPDIVVARAAVSADRVKTVMKDASPAQRDQVFYALDDEMLQEINHGLETTVKPAFGLN
jgi:hypothetical protein